MVLFWPVTFSSTCIFQFLKTFFDIATRYRSPSAAWQDRANQYLMARCRMPSRNNSTPKRKVDISYLAGLSQGRANSEQPVRIAQELTENSIETAATNNSNSSRRTVDQRHLDELYQRGKRQQLSRICFTKNVFRYKLCVITEQTT